MRFFEKMPLLPDDAIFSLPILFAADQRPQKVNLGIGIYQNEDGRNVVLPSVRKAEALISAKELGKNYLPIDGDTDFIHETSSIIFGNANTASEDGRAFVVQTPGGACALRLGAEFLSTLVSRNIFLSNPSWINHKNIFTRAGLEVHNYPYFERRKHILDFTSLCDAINRLPAGSVLLLQGCGHNPTGVDPTKEQWRELSALIKEKKVIPFFDLAYQGFCCGLEEDAYAVRYFAEQNHEMLVAYSFSKNMGLYGERVGALAILSETQEESRKVASQVRQMIRGIYSTPPLQGGRIAALILKNDGLRAEWEKEVDEMRTRLQNTRQNFAMELEKNILNIDYRFVSTQKGMFTYCGLTPLQVELLIKKYAIYLPSDGRINVAGLNKHNFAYAVESILETITA